MSVTDDQVATLRAYLAGDFDKYEQLNARLDRDTDGAGFGALIAGGFFEAVDRRFTTNSSAAEVIEFVSDVRAKSVRLSESIDPQVAERLIRHSLGEGSIIDLDNSTVVRTQLLLLAAIIVDEQLDDLELDKFMTEVRALADRLMS